jgi:sulfoxide reductase catalytic subunit YedY
MRKISASEITPEQLYLSRRAFLKSMGIVTAGALLAACAPQRTKPSSAAQANEPAAVAEPTSQAGVTVEAAQQAQAEPEALASGDELGDALTPYEAVTNYNNFYEFSVDKQAVAALAQSFTTSPWQVSVGGLVNKPKTYGLEDILARFTQEERVYRLRCVEAWSMVIPWVGFPLAQLLKEVEPTSDAKYVRFESVLRPEEMPGQKDAWFDWPYVEGLRLDEAMHDLTILATGLYGNPLPRQDGAPIRLVVPWKYGFKSIKSIVKIDLVAEMPVSLWMAAAPNEYGFYANVNPSVNHPRWSQASERRIGELSRRETLMFNGYEEEVASLYEGLDLRVNY